MKLLPFRSRPIDPLAVRDILLAAMDYAQEAANGAIDDVTARMSASLAGEKG